MWIVLPEGTVAELLRNPGARDFLADKLLSDSTTAFGVDTPPADGSIGQFMRTDDRVRLLGLWNRQDRKPIKVNDAHLLSIWIDPDESTLGAVDDSRSEVIERICRLAQRLWYGLTIADYWKPRKVEGVQTIRAGDRRLEDLFFAYQVRGKNQRHRHYI